MTNKFELKSLIGSKFLEGSPTQNSFKVDTDGKIRNFFIQDYAPTFKGNIFALVHCYNAKLKDDDDRIIADVIYDGEITNKSCSTYVTFVNAENKVLYGIYAFEGQHESNELAHCGKVYVEELSNGKIMGVEELV